ncbi:flagellar assembly protein FliH [Micromonospora pattaloongensis]|uniref:Flagellar assembly protein FliH n=1 Tax=Micromonospora pattaloongensis TaxID=405436 RepID=A0A1H3MY15_9ACTN|nr:FliH/SctL family protein [Micromonospora pattaloongensis]SDY81115.1 flagellar assembly protein FliH [Micromonospora pattaloongensis]
MSSSRDPRRLDPVLRGTHARGVTPARFDTDLRGTANSPADTTASTRESARAAGYAEGWAQGQRAAGIAARAAADQAAAARREAEAAAEMKLARALEALGRAAAQLEQRSAPTIAMMEELILAAAVELTQSLLGRELAAVDSRARDALARAMSLTPPAEPVTVRLHPDDYQTLLADDWSEEFHIDGRTVQLRPDPTLEPGDAVAEAGSTTIDATLPAALARVKEVLGQ